MSIDYERMTRFVKDYFESRDPLGTELTWRFPFRRRFEHCLRVVAWAERIALAEHADLEIVRISALFHDIGKALENNEAHAETGARILEDYLASIDYDKTGTEKCVLIVRTHSNHARESDASLEAKVMSDADLLDEVGAITVLWDAMACAGEEAPSYDKAFSRISGGYNRLKNTLPGRIHTATARGFFAERLAFLDTFLENLEYELGRTT